MAWHAFTGVSAVVESASHAGGARRRGQTAVGGDDGDVLANCGCSDDPSRGGSSEQRRPAFVGYARRLIAAHAMHAYGAPGTYTVNQPSLETRPFAGLVQVHAQVEWLFPKTDAHTPWSYQARGLCAGPQRRQRGMTTAVNANGDEGAAWPLQTARWGATICGTGDCLNFEQSAV